MNGNDFAADAANQRQIGRIKIQPVREGFKLIQCLFRVGAELGLVADFTV